ncbi:hypothetical protein C9374_012341 [Naegleria lovaniensis]|uniref:Uncharacterized protein n=1 Tax=Naegleria lovaniensis TaxID=51637 RepID=A0AA88GD34_NAELO|nr:uncharacterized protein C9374_012341 [Naegleria lovaniensis]KAG2373238.1 hypothetical protein C9374_012341 [Naegleria lovaniensis]
MSSINKSSSTGSSSSTATHAPPCLRIMLTGVVPTPLLGKSVSFELSNHTSRELISLTISQFKLRILDQLLIDIETEEEERNSNNNSNSNNNNSNNNTNNNSKQNASSSSDHHLRHHHSNSETSSPSQKVKLFISQAKIFGFKLIKMGFVMEDSQHLIKYLKNSNVTGGDQSELPTTTTLHAVFQDYNSMIQDGLEQVDVYGNLKEKQGLQALLSQSSEDAAPFHAGEISASTSRNGFLSCCQIL